MGRTHFGYPVGVDIHRVHVDYRHSRALYLSKRKRIMKITKQIRHMIAVAALISLISAAAFSVSADTPEAIGTTDPESFIRVGLFYGSSGVGEVVLTGAQGYALEVEGYEEETVVIDVPTLTLNAENGSLHVSTAFGGEVASAQTGVKIRIFPADSGEIISVNGVPYRGGYEFYADAANTITVINVLDIEGYLRGVLPSEVYTSWHMEALKAAAVAARTYALKNAVASSHSASGFDVCATTHCQMYSGIAKENERTNDAILQTAGLVVKYEGELAMTPYHSSGGGYTESASSAWGGNPALYPYLTTVFTPYEDYRNVPGGKWESMIAPDSLTDFIPSSYASKLNGGIADITYDRAPSGYIHSMTVTDGEGGTQTFTTSSAVRSFFGTLVRSANFGIAKTHLPSDTASPAVRVISAEGEYDLTGIDGYSVLSADGEKSYAGFTEVLVFDGQGYGHGVGLSQFGARCMADAGFTYEEILGTYFPGTVIEPLFAASETDAADSSVTDDKE